MSAHDDLEAWLARPLPALPAEPFCAAVMQRVRGEADAVAPAEALARSRDLSQRAASAGRALRFGAGAGFALAAALFVALGDAAALASADPNRLALGVVLAGATLAWALLAPERLSPGS